MGNDAVLTKSLVLLAAISVFTALYTQSLKKMGATYLYGMLVVCGFALPDWTFFNRPIPQWADLVTINNANHYHNDAANHSQSRFKLYPVRLVMYTAVYGFVFYEWWNFVRG